MNRSRIDYQPGDKIHILPKQRLGDPYHLNSLGKMDPWLDTVATVAYWDGDCARIQEDDEQWLWKWNNIEPYDDGSCISIDYDVLMNFL